MSPSLPPGQCQCGCGGRTKIASQSRLRCAKGEYARFLPGHHQYQTPEPTVDENGCWNWQGTLTDRGYGTVRLKGKVHRAHRLAYERHVGPIPEGLEIDHLCGNRACVNPAHLEAVTHTENMRRAKNTKLSLEEAEKIRAAKGSKPGTEIAAEYGMNPESIYRIWTGQTWAA